MLFCSPKHLGSRRACLDHFTWLWGVKERRGCSPLPRCCGSGAEQLDSLNPKKKILRNLRTEFFALLIERWHIGPAHRLGDG